MTRACPAISFLAKPGTPPCTCDCASCRCIARVLGAPAPSDKESRDG